MTDHELLQQCTQHQSKDALCQLMQRHIAMVHAAATRELKDPNRADDATQAVFLVFMRRAPSLSPNVCLTGWLFKVTRFVIAQSRRESARRLFHEREAAAMQPPPETSSPETPWPEVLPHLNDAIAALPRADRDAIILRHLENKPIEHVAAALGTSENTARQRVFRALDRLRKLLLKKRLFIGAAALTAGLEQSATHAAPPALIQTVTNILSVGTAPSAASLLLAKGVLSMMWNTKLTLTIAAAAAVFTITAGIYVASAAETPAKPAPAPPAPPAAQTAPAATAPVLAKLQREGPAKNPKQTVINAFTAAREGDEEVFLSCATALTVEQTETLRIYSRVLAAYDTLGNAVGKKFGADAQTQFTKTGGFGVSMEDLANGKETINGNNASLNIGRAGPGTVALVKDGEFWKVAPETFTNMPSAQIRMAEAMTPILKKIAADVDSDKITSLKDVWTAVQSNMPKQPPPNQLP